MKNKIDVELEVSKLEENEKSLILKVGKFYALVLGLVSVSVFVFVLCSFCMVLDIDKNHMIASSLLTSCMIVLTPFLIFAIAAFIFVKVKYPVYSDKKYRYIKKNSK